MYCASRRSVMGRAQAPGAAMAAFTASATALFFPVDVSEGSWTRMTDEPVVSSMPKTASSTTMSGRCSSSTSGRPVRPSRCVYREESTGGTAPGSFHSAASPA